MDIRRIATFCKDYVLASALVLAAVWLRILLVPVLGSASMYLTVFPTVMWIAVLRGGPGILASVIGALAVEGWLVPPEGIVFNQEFYSHTFLLVFTGGFLAVVGQRLRRERNHARVHAAALQESERRLQEAQAAGHVGIYDWDVALDRVYVSEEGRKIFSIPESEYPRLSWRQFHKFRDPEDEKRVTAQLFQMMRGHRPAIEFDYRVGRPDGKMQWVNSRARISYNPNGQAMRMVGTVVDITDRKLAEQSLKEADQRKDEFLAMLAHELRNPLAPIRNAVYLLKLTGHSPCPMEKYRAMIERQVSHMSRLLDDLLDVSRITRGTITLKRKQLRLADILTYAVEIAKPLVSSRGHWLEVLPPEPDVLVEGDPDRLVQIVGNLLTNAAKYTDEGGRIWLSGGREDRWAVVRVKDNGMGIEAEMLGKIFGLFTQTRRALDRSQGGLGIGLRVVRQLVEMHGGTVEAASPGLGKGSTFTVRLPLALPDAPEADPARNSVEGQALAPRHRILVVEDVADTADSLAELLRSWGHLAKTACDGVEALEHYRTFRPDVVLLDIGLPGLDGYQLARRLRRFDADLRIVAISGYGQAVDQQTARSAGIQSYLVKPVDPPLLQEVLASQPQKT